ncbi:DUF4174 domain-containing protein [Pantoea phytobeneficialis]|uniref:DUF4174 domain-containing protein n=1 Tax=Pantoea phytobeneficialis TaxID=2052056 RepID=A0AAP9HB01_9GAMM|nr:DUF4174 domain-containing protein [Pantoea phytobeneficialis]MDO6409934.1 DUF4174 domain-containing protein [Pantoea phytobeneficialis]QGR09786.1 hypothetical protein CTZ24_25400 [Pantoea phytobeneficialis]
MITACFPAQWHPGKSLLLAALLLVLCSAAHAAESSLFRTLPPDTADLSQYRWHSRPVVIFAPSTQDASYLEQMAMLEKAQTALAERDVIVLTDTAPTKQGQLRSQLQPKGFEVVLVGKDGGMKLRDTRPISSEILLSTIDQMPMRKANLD